ncbi:MAG: matrixin family metalloprotease, partial [Bacteriovorax sp.]|nr:matrixin family metalloprotease [Bacteriovorax sp.]
LTASSIEALARDAVEEFWDKVSTSSLKLNIKSITTTSLSGDTLTSAVNKTPTNSIIIGCNQNATLFTSNTILAVGGMGCAGTSCAGAVIINDIAGTNMASVDRQTLISTIAHELGHAFGLGHTSVKSALMYYDSTGVVNKALHQDDIDGVTYLYPNEKKISGLAGACGSVDMDNSDKGNFFISQLVGLLLILSISYLFKRKPNVIN